MPVYLKFNTGMNRLGLPVAANSTAALAALEAIPAVGDITLMTHFADADMERGIAEQLARLRASWSAAAAFPASLANSATPCCAFPTPTRDWVRPGIMLYGASPFADLKSAAALGLQPVMTLRARSSPYRSSSPATASATAVSSPPTAPMRIGVVACGYADGYPRHAPNGTPILVDGSRSEHGRAGVDGHAGGRPDAPAGRRASVPASCCGARGCRPTRWLPRPEPSATSCCAPWRRACR